MILSAYHFDGDPDALMESHRRMMELFPPTGLDLHIAVTHEHGVTVYDSCPDLPTHEAFARQRRVPGRDRRQVGLPPPAIEILGDVHFAHPQPVGPAVTTLAAELRRWTPPAQAELVRRGEVTARRAGRGGDRADRGAEPDAQRRRHPMFDQALAPGQRAALTVRSPACRSWSRTWSSRCDGVRFTEGSRFLAGNVSTFDQELVAAAAPRGARDPRQDQHARVRHGAHLRAACCSARPATRGTRAGPPAARAAARPPAVASGMVPMAHGNDLGGSIRYPGLGVRAVRAQADPRPQPARARVRRRRRRLGGRARADPVRCATAPRCSTRPRGPAIGDPYWAPPPARPFVDEVGTDPGRLRIAYTARTPDGDPATPTASPRSNDAVRLCESLGHDVERERLARLHTRGRRRDRTSDPRPPSRGSCATGSAASAASPAPTSSSRSPARYWEGGRRVSAADYLLAIEEAQRFSRRVAQFFPAVDLFLTPTMSSAAAADRNDGRPRPRSRCTPWSVGAPSVRYAGRRRQHHRQSGHVGAAVVERRRPADRRALPRPLRRRGDVVPARRTARASTAVEPPSATDPRHAPDRHADVAEPPPRAPLTRAH